MGRKRLLTILTTLTLAVGVPAGAASAQTIGVPGVGGIDLGSGDDEDCLQVGVDIGLGDLVGLDPSVCVLDEDGDLIDIEGGANIGGQDVPVGEATQPVEDAVNEGAAAVRDRDPAPEPSVPAPKPAPEPEPEPSTPPASGGGGGGDTSGGGGGEATNGGGRTPDQARAPEVADPAAEQASREAHRAHQLATLRALRSDLASGAIGETGVQGPVRPGLGGTSSLFGEAAAPEVADGALAPGVATGDPADVPFVADAQEEAVLATSGTGDGGRQTPVALQLLAGALVLGSAGVWLVARRELGGSAFTTA